MGVYKGADDAYTKEMMDWWLMEPDLVDKMFKVGFLCNSKICVISWSSEKLG